MNEETVVSEETAGEQAIDKSVTLFPEEDSFLMEFWDGKIEGVTFTW